MIEEEQDWRLASLAAQGGAVSHDAWRGIVAAAALSLALGMPRSALADEAQERPATDVLTADVPVVAADDAQAKEGDPASSEEDGAEPVTKVAEGDAPADAPDAGELAPVLTSGDAGQDQDAGQETEDGDADDASDTGDDDSASAEQVVADDQGRRAAQGATTSGAAKGDASSQDADTGQTNNADAGQGSDAGSQTGDGQDQGSDQGSDSPGTTTQPIDGTQPTELGGETTTPKPETAPQKKPKKPKTPKNGWWTDRKTGNTYFYKKGKRQHGWVVTRRIVKSNRRGTVSRRYWLDAKGRLARGRFVNPNSARDKVKGAYYAYARKNGVIFTGVARRKGTKSILLARSNGRLLSLSGGKHHGWITTKAFDPKGKRRRYLLQRAKNGSYYVRAGYSTLGYAHYATDKGYVRTGVWKSSGRIYIASDKGRLATLKNSRAKSGWLDSSAFGQGTQRYYLYRTKGGANKGMCYALPGFSRSDYPHYTTGKGYVLRDGLYDIGSTHYLVDREGRAEQVSDAQVRMINNAWNTPAAPPGYCAGWVENVAARTGLGHVGGDARDFYWRYCRNADMSSIKAGSIIAVSTHSHTEDGSIWGHVAIYVGNGKVRDSVYGHTRTTDLSWWVSYYGTTVKPKWGWYGNRALG